MKFLIVAIVAAVAFGFTCAAPSLEEIYYGEFEFFGPEEDYISLPDKLKCAITTVSKALEESTVPEPILAIAKQLRKALREIRACKQLQTHTEIKGCLREQSENVSTLLGDLYSLLLEENFKNLIHTIVESVVRQCLYGQVPIEPEMPELPELAQLPQLPEEIGAPEADLFDIISIRRFPIVNPTTIIGENFNETVKHVRCILGAASNVLRQESEELQAVWTDVKQQIVLAVDQLKECKKNATSILSCRDELLAIQNAVYQLVNYCKENNLLDLLSSIKVEIRSKCIEPVDQIEQTV